MKTPATRAKKAKHHLAARYIGETFMLTDSEAWTWLRVPAQPYEFRDEADRKQLATHIYLSLAALVTNNQPVEVALIQSPRLFDTETWVEGWQSRVERWASIGGIPSPGWEDYRDSMADFVDTRGYLTKEVYLGVRLGDRNTITRSTFTDFFEVFKKGAAKVENALDLDNFRLTAKEAEAWKVKAREVHRSLGQSHIAAVPATRDEVAWLIQRPMYPFVEGPEAPALADQDWGPNEIAALGEGYIDNHRRYLGITQVDWVEEKERTGYTATLCFARFPDVLYFPAQEPWMHFAAALAYPVDLISRFTIVPAIKVAKDVGRKLNEAKDQASHIAETGSAVPLEVQEQYERAMALEFTISRDRQPWVYGRHRLRVSAATPEELTSRVKRIVEHYRDLGIDVAWPSGDQFNLLMEAMPGGPVCKNGYYQRQELHLIGGGMPIASAEAGDKVVDGKGWRGAFIGETTSRVCTPVFYSPHVAMTRNRPPGTAIIGSPGGGKSYLAFTLAHDLAQQGVWTIYIDPKADAKPMGELNTLRNPKVIDLRDGHDGILDPWSLADDGPQARLLALETVRLLLGRIERDQEEALIGAVERVSAEPQPSLSRVVQLLEIGETPEARTLGMVLRNVRDLPFARLCFAPAGVHRIRAEDGLTIITLLGLDLPEADTPQADYSYENRLAVGVMYLLTRFARRLMLSSHKDFPKAIFIDEFWAISTTPQGAKLVPELARMGRSHNCALTVVTQNAGDLSTQAVTNSISTVFAFRSKNNAEIKDVLDLMGVEANEGNQATVRDLYDGECLMKDIDGRVARVQVLAWEPNLKKTFDTNPDTRDNRQEETHDHSHGPRAVPGEVA